MWGGRSRGSASGGEASGRSQAGCGLSGALAVAPHCDLGLFLYVATERGAGIQTLSQGPPACSDLPVKVSDVLVGVLYCFVRVRF